MSIRCIDHNVHKRSQALDTVDSKLAHPVSHRRPSQVKLRQAASRSASSPAALFIRDGEA